MNICKDENLKEKDLFLLKELEEKLNKLKMEKDAANIFNGFSTNNAFDKILAEDEKNAKNAKNENCEKLKIFENEKNSENSENENGLLKKIDNLLGGKAKEIINITNETFMGKIKDMKLKEKIRKEIFLWKIFS
jgi:hypothetical protein